MNVALSRAKDLVIIIGNADTMDVARAPQAAGGGGGGGVAASDAQVGGLPPAEGGPAALAAESARVGRRRPEVNQNA